MINPCSNCPNRVEYDEYDKHHGEVILSREPMPTTPHVCHEKTHIKMKQKTAPPIKKPRSEGFSSKEFFKEIHQCAMGGCILNAEIKGYCSSCYTLRRYYAAQGRLAPDSLTPLQIKRRRGQR
jgi:hypothetical protein